MTSSERKKLWVQRMRNEGETNPAQPRRTAVTVYLRKEAREVLSNERQLAQECNLPPRVDSELIEQLLLGHAKNAYQEIYRGMSLKDLIEQINLIKAERDRAEYLLRRLDENIPRHNFRSLKHLIAEKPVTPTPKELAQKYKNNLNDSKEYLINSLIPYFQKLFEKPMDEKELKHKVREEIEAIIDSVFGL